MKNTVKKIILVAGARPNFMKIAPLMHALEGHPSIKPVLVHTGQHYDVEMSGRFFEELRIPEPHINLEVGSASQAVQMARIMERFEPVCLQEKPDYLLVVGDVTSTAACALVAVKLGITTIHYEAGLRSLDRTMPEEINRLVTDAISDVFFTTSKDADDNLLREGVDPKKVYMVGNLMIDTLVENRDRTGETQLTFQLLNHDRVITAGVDFQAGEYGVLTFHRPVNVDQKETLEQLVDIWGRVSRKTPLLFPVHPRTYKNIREFGLERLLESYPELFLVDSLGYLQFIHLVEQSKFVLTDSGGIQEETTFMNIPCLTVRPTTERPVTIWEGSNKLIGVGDIEKEVDTILSGCGKKGHRPRYWDGDTAKRMIAIIENM